MTEAILNDLESILAVVKTRAAEGDMTAAGLLLSRTLPTLRPEGTLAQFELDLTLPLSKQVDQVLLAVSEGRLSVERAQDIAKILQARAEIVALENGGTSGADALVAAFREIAKVVEGPGIPYHPPGDTE